MLRNYFKTAFRHLAKNKLYAAINVLGLATGLAACLLIGVYITHELSYDNFNTNAGRIVRATMEYKKADNINTTANTGTRPGPEFKRKFPEVVDYTRTYIQGKIIKNAEKTFEEPRVLYADAPFLSIFSFAVLQGNAATALDAPDKIVLTQSMAKKYFGSENSLNKTITCGSKDLTVSAIIADVPKNSQLSFDFITPFQNLGNNVKEENWWTANWVTYFLLRHKKDIPAFQQKVDAYMNTPAIKASANLQGNEYLAYHMEPLLSVHMYSALAGFEPNGNIRYIYMFAAIALLILIIATANYTNLATAQSAGRSSEIGMRKVMGASKKQVFIQFIGESSLITFIAAGLAILLSLLLVPYFNYITGKQFTQQDMLQPLPLTALLLCALLVSFFAGLYPALVLSGMQVMGVLKKGFAFTGGNNLLRKTLIVAQFSISVFLICYTLVILQQMRFMQNKQLGYDKAHVLVLPLGGNMLDEFQQLKTAFSSVRGVESVTASYDTPEFVRWQDDITATDEQGQHNISVTAMPVDLDFTATLKMQMAAGRDFQQPDFAMMDTSNNSQQYRQPYLINEVLAEKIGWNAQQAIGKTIEKNDAGPVLGVVKNFNFNSLHHAIGPMVFFLNRDFSRDFILRINGNSMPATIEQLAAVWKQRVPSRPFTYHFLDEQYNKLYDAERKTALLFSAAAGIAIVLASLGLFGLAAFTTMQRTREIGIRKVLGASAASISLLLSKHFLSLAGIAILIALPFAWWAAHVWLQDFAFRIPVQWYVFIITSLATVAIVLLTVGYHAMKAAMANPVKSLRAE